MTENLHADLDAVAERAPSTPLDWPVVRAEAKRRTRRRRILASVPVLTLVAAVPLAWSAVIGGGDRLVQQAGPAPGADTSGSPAPTRFTIIYDDAATYEAQAGAVQACLDVLSDPQVTSEDSLPPIVNVSITGASEAPTFQSCTSDLNGVTVTATEAGPSTGGDPAADGGAYANPMRSTISREQKARPGADATDACGEAQVSSFVDSMNNRGDVRLLGGYYADGPGMAAWGAELHGGQAVLDPTFQWVPELHVLCWFSGDFTAPGSDGQGSPASHIIVSSRLFPDPALTVTASARAPIGIFAPAVPAERNEQTQDAVAVVHPQPSGVREAPAPPDRTLELQAELNNLHRG